MRWSVQVPSPMSVWRLYKGHGHGKTKSKAYYDWRQTAGQEMVAQGRRPEFPGPVSIPIEMGEDGVSPAFDTDNAAKAYIDLLVEMGVIKDDNRMVVRRLHLNWRDGDGSRITVEALDG